MTEQRFFRLALGLPFLFAGWGLLVPGWISVLAVLPVLGAGLPYAVFALLAYRWLGRQPPDAVPRAALLKAPWLFFPFVALPGAVILLLNAEDGRAVLSLAKGLGSLLAYCLGYGYFYLLCALGLARVVLPSGSRAS